jgi:carbamoyltransferase
LYPRALSQLFLHNGVNILGLHFGHDGAVAIITDGIVRTVLLTERITRVKHAVGIDRALIERALKATNLTLNDIDYCAIATTQTIPIILSRKDEISLDFSAATAAALPHIPSPIAAEPYASGNIWLSNDTFDFSMRIWKERRAASDTAKRLSIYRDGLDDLEVVMPPENVVSPVQWREQWPDLGRLSTLPQMKLKDLWAAQDSRFVFHHPCTITISGKTIPGVFVDHQAAHAADTYYHSGLSSALILCYDGASQPMSAGLLCLAQGNTIVPVARPYTWLGGFYNCVANAVSLGYDAGKLMGLAPYGVPNLFDPAYVETARILRPMNAIGIADRWLKETLERAKKLGYSLDALGKRAQVLEPINADLAASAHKTFEENVLALIRGVAAAARNNHMPFDGICLSGGCALSCPTNTLIAGENMGHVFVPPSCDDTGLAVGAALWMHHNLLSVPVPSRPVGEPISPYQGADIAPADVEQALARFGDSIRVEHLGKRTSIAAAEDLTADKVIGWFEGRSEIGPRALGHRSLLADPRKAANWPRVNEIKGREKWRPFAPAVLEEKASAHFSGMPFPSPYMLFTGDVLDRSALPAITHTDGTARVQTVSRKTGGFHDLLAAFDAQTGCPVVMNTSLNGPGEPIVEAPEEAVRFLMKSDMDVLYVDGHRVTKRS